MHTPGRRTGAERGGWGAAVALACLAFLAACTVEPIATPTPRPVPSGTITPNAVRTATRAPTATPVPASPTPAPDPVISPAPPTLSAPPSSPRLRRLSAPGCCAGPFWSSDGRTVLYIDRPAPDQPLGLYGLDALAAAPTPMLYSERLVSYSAGGAFVVYRNEQGLAVIERVADGQRWLLSSAGTEPAVSPGGRWVAWTDSALDGPYDSRRAVVRLVDLQAPDDVRPLVTVWGGGLIAWLPDGASVLVVGRPSLARPESELSVVSVPDGKTTVLLRETSIANIALSPDGKWVLATVFFSANASRDGLWLLATSGEEPRRLRFYGAYQWRDARRIVYVPLRASPSDSHVFRQYQVLTREDIALTDPSKTFFSIAGNDWAISPDGRRIAFVESQDRAIWLLDLGD